MRASSNAEPPTTGSCRYLLQFQSSRGIRGGVDTFLGAGAGKTHGYTLVTDPLTGD